MSILRISDVIRKKSSSEPLDSQGFSIFKIICKAISLEEIQDFGNKYLATHTETIPFAITNLGVLDRILNFPEEHPRFKLKISQVQFQDPYLQCLYQYLHFKVKCI